MLKNSNVSISQSQCRCHKTNENVLGHRLSITLDGLSIEDASRLKKSVESEIEKLMKADQDESKSENGKTKSA